MLAAQGFLATYFPTMAFGPPTDGQAMKEGIAGIGDEDWLIFISPQAVHSSAPYLREYWPTLPGKLKLVAMGEGTAKALKEAGFEVHLQPKQTSNSESLLEEAALKTVSGQKITLIRGDGGRDALDRGLTERGATVSHVITYRRVLPTADPTVCRQQFHDHLFDVMICTSFEGVYNLKQLMGEACWPLVKLVPLVVVSERVKRLASDLGFTTIWLATSASNDALLTCLLDKKEMLCQSK